MLLRIDRILSDMGLATRSEAKKMIKDGRVAVSGAAVRSPEYKIDPEKEELLLDGAPLRYKKTVCIMLNKPAGYISATDDPRDQTVLELLPGDLKKRGVAPAGRLDKDAEGLLLLTDDGDLAHRIISPVKKVWKKYYVRFSGVLDENDGRAFAEGLDAGGGLICKPARLEPLAEGEAFLSITEGKFHQVKRMFASRGKPVEYLKRVSVGGLELDESLALGDFRELEQDEIDKIFLGNM